MNALDQSSSLLKWFPSPPLSLMFPNSWTNNSKHQHRSPNSNILTLNLRIQLIVPNASFQSWKKSYASGKWKLWRWLTVPSIPFFLKSSSTLQTCLFHLYQCCQQLKKINFQTTISKRKQVCPFQQLKIQYLPLMSNTTYCNVLSLEAFILSSSSSTHLIILKHKSYYIQRKLPKSPSKNWIAQDSYVLERNVPMWWIRYLSLK